MKATSVMLIKGLSSAASTTESQHLVLRQET